MLIYKVFYFHPVSSAMLYPYAHKNQNQSAYPFGSAKPFYFSGLIAYSQRNDHFCGCKGTHIYLITQYYLAFI